MSITATQVKELRDRSGVGMMDCKKALEEASGDLDKAFDILRKSGIAKAQKKQEDLLKMEMSPDLLLVIPSAIAFGIKVPG